MTTKAMASLLPSQLYLSRENYTAGIWVEIKICPSCKLVGYHADMKNVCRDCGHTPLSYGNNVGRFITKHRWWQRFASRGYWEVK